MKTLNFSNHTQFAVLPISFTAAGAQDNFIVPAVAGTSVYVARFYFLVSTGCNPIFYDGPQASGTALSGALPLISDGSGWTCDLSNDWWYITSKGNGFNLYVDAAVTVGGSVWYRQF